MQVTNIYFKLTEMNNTINIFFIIAMSGASSEARMVSKSRSWQLYFHRLV